MREGRDTKKEIIALVNKIYNKKNEGVTSREIKDNLNYFVGEALVHKHLKQLRNKKNPDRLDFKIEKRKVSKKKGNRELKRVYVYFPKGFL